ncbi:MAG: DUF4118 domain-containing protein [Alphaproteobacteria bacterium]|nr:DUF4118 domain-containing protein [Alphaproteobacteria bacterium]
MPQVEKDKRPDPDILLSQIEADERKQKRGKLKIFFGSSAGVGKTYAMLQEAHRRQREGADVLVGIVETHGRQETLQLLEGLPILPRRSLSHRNVTMSEFDIDEVLKIRPDILLLDELAHSNAPGSRHPKRWQDVEELIQAGIDVYTTLNVQHLESLNDVISSITGISVRETVPDRLFDEADNIVLVDTPPDELLARLRDGKVYIAPGANERSVQNFFRKTNLQSLRELALRRTADYVDIDSDEQRRREGLRTPNAVGEKIMVCVGSDAFAAKLVRTGRRLATGLKSPWLVTYVETPVAEAQDLRSRQHIQHVLHNAETNGAEVVTLTGTRVGDELINYARNNGITKIVIGKSGKPYWASIFKKNLAEFIVTESGDIDVYIVTTPAALSVAFNRRRVMPMSRHEGMRYGYAAILVSAITFGAYQTEFFFTNMDTIMLYLIGVMVTAAGLGRGPSLLYSVLCVSAFNFFFTEPRFTFNVYDSSYWLTFTVMFLTSVTISSLATKLRDQLMLARRREHETQIFYNLTRELTATRTREEMSETVIRRISQTIGGDICIWYPGKKGMLELVYGSETGDFFKEEVVADWCYKNGQPAGLGTNTMPSACLYYLPVTGTNMTLGVVGIRPKNDIFLHGQALIMETFVSLLGSALERSETAEAAEQAGLLAEKERVRNILLSSVSHDLRSPLAAITGAADTLLQEPHDTNSETAQRLLRSIRHEAARLTKVVSNLLEITRIEGGRLKLNVHPYFPPEIIGSAAESCRETLKNHKLLLKSLQDIPFVNMDGLLISQVIQNLLENATSHTPPGTEITVFADMYNNGLRISVSDNGPGIPPGQEREIFKKFATFDQGDRPKGAGLGLAICQAIVSAHMGRIYAETNRTGGARFVIELPSELTIPELS